MASDLMTPSEVTARLRVSRQTLARYADSGHLSAVVLPGGHRRYNRAEVEAMARGEANPAVPA